MRHSRNDVTERTRHEYRQLDRFAKKLEPPDWRRRVPRPGTKDPWTVKDALAHIVYCKEHSARAFRGEKRPPELQGLEANAINAVIYRRWRRRRPADVLDWASPSSVPALDWTGWPGHSGTDERARISRIRACG